MKTFRDSAAKAVQSAIMKAPESKKRELETLVKQAGEPDVLALQIWNGASIQQLDDRLFLKLTVLFGAFDDNLAIEMFCKQFNKSEAMRKTKRSILNTMKRQADAVSDHGLLGLNHDLFIAAILAGTNASQERIYQLIDTSKDLVLWLHQNDIDTELYRSIGEMPSTQLRDEIPLTRITQAKYVGSPQELANLLRVAWNEQAIHTGVVVAILAYTGLTLKQIVALSSSDVTIKHDSIEIHGKERTLCPDLCEMIRAYTAEKTVMVLWRGGALTPFYAAESPYFIKQYTRSPKHSDVPLTVEGVVRILYLTHAVCRENVPDSAELTCKTLNDAYVFYQLLQKEKAGEVIDKTAIQKAFRISSPLSVKSKMTTYRLFAELYGEN